MAEKKPSRLFQLMADMSGDPDLLKAFRKNPEKVMSDYKLGKRQQKLIVSAITENRQHDAMRVVADEAHEHFGGHPDTSIIP